MRSCISISGCVRRSVCWSVGQSYTSWIKEKGLNLNKIASGTRNYAMRPGLSVIRVLLGTEDSFLWIGGEGGDGTSDAFLWMFHISPLTLAGSKGAARSRHMDYELIFKGRCLMAELATKWRGECTMGQNQVVLKHWIIHCPTSEGVSEMSEWVRERSRAREQSQQGGASKRVSGPSKRASGPLLQSGFLVMLANSAHQISRIESRYSLLLCFHLPARITSTTTQSQVLRRFSSECHKPLE